MNWKKHLIHDGKCNNCGLPAVAGPFCGPACQMEYRQEREAEALEDANHEWQTPEEDSPTGQDSLR